MSKFVRSRRAVWGDARFLIGIAVVALSIGGVWAVVSSSGTTTPVLQATRTITLGEALVSDDFQVVEVGLGTVRDRYLAPQELHAGQVASRTVVAGELMATSAAEDADANRTTTIVVESSTGIPADVTAGSIIELWHSPPIDDGGSQGPPRILVADAIVASVTKTEGMLAAEGTTAEVVIDRADVAEVLAAITGGSVLSVVPIGSTR
ncbi:SAF domain-containing protein [Microbacterium sp. WCS2018Hpa-9]|uniref:SAF domain-containing protein n=1 Tax=Microbacterium sp. WCS2018Hpa-9 TaxID=3073635 RepID=UPI00288B2115|nr:SAF domain-containing protein [Microbacterium sp. WCS2018Hpa-9]